MGGHMIVGFGCFCLLLGCANNAARELGGTDNATIAPSVDAGREPNGGGNPGPGNGSEMTAPEDPGSDAGVGPSDASSAQGDGSVVTPTASKLVFSEMMARPSGGSSNEWLELYNAGDTSVSLTGCALATGERALGGTEIAGSLSIAPKAYLLLGRDGVEEKSGVKPDYVYDGVYLSPDEIVSLTCAGRIVARVSYQGAGTATSLQLDQRYVIASKADANAFCAGTDTLPLGDNLGTPKAANRDCAGVPSP